MEAKRSNEASGNGSSSTEPCCTCSAARRARSPAGGGPSPPARPRCRARGSRRPAGQAPRPACRSRAPPPAPAAPRPARAGSSRAGTGRGPGRRRRSGRALRATRRGCRDARASVGAAELVPELGVALGDVGRRHAVRPSRGRGVQVEPDEAVDAQPHQPRPRDLQRSERHAVDAAPVDAHVAHPVQEAAQLGHGHEVGVRRRAAARGAVVGVPQPRLGRRRAGHQPVARGEQRPEEHAPRRVAVVDHQQQLAARPQHAARLGHSARQVARVVQAADGDDAVEGGVREGQVERRALLHLLRLRSGDALEPRPAPWPPGRRRCRARGSRRRRGPATRPRCRSRGRSRARGGRPSPGARR